MPAKRQVHDHLHTLADPTRGRLLGVLNAQELTVRELCAVLQLPQSTVSRHLRVLADEQWVVSRQEGTSRYYALNPHLDAPATKLWGAVAEEIVAGTAVQRDRARLSSVRAQRRAKSREFFSSGAARWDAMRADLYGTQADLIALMGLLDDSWVVGDLGSGTGRLSETLAPYVARVIAVDASEEMLAAAKRRLADAQNVDFRLGDLESLPLEAGALDAAVLSLVLHHTAEPAAVLGEAARVLRPGGRLMVVDMLPHEHAEYQQQMGHVWLGFSEEQMENWLLASGLEHVRVRRLPVDAAARGPLLFSASARRPVQTRASA